MSQNEPLLKNHRRGDSVITLQPNSGLFSLTGGDVEKVLEVYRDIEMVLRDRLANDMGCLLQDGETAYDYLVRKKTGLAIDLKVLSEGELCELEDEYGDGCADKLYGTETEYVTHAMDRAYALTFTPTMSGIAPMWLIVTKAHSPNTYMDRSEGGEELADCYNEPLVHVHEYELLRDALVGADVSCYSVRRWYDCL